MKLKRRKNWDSSPVKVVIDRLDNLTQSCSTIEFVFKQDVGAKKSL